MIRIYIGIDPGQSGACAILPSRKWKNVLTDYGDMSIINDLQYHASLYHHGPEECELLAAIEKITVNKGTPTKARGGMVKVMCNMERWAGRLEALEIPFIFVAPTKWQNLVFDSMTRKKDRKDMSLDLARRLFPWADLSLKKHHGRADALLIARYLQIIERAK